jgi:CRP-like cAMP-binding protein
MEAIYPRGTANFMPTSTTFQTTELPRGGTLIENGDFRLQLGSYPETIKDTMKMEKSVPNLFLLPDDLFDTFLGVSNSDLEFPVYFNYFIKQGVCRFICHKHQVRPIIRVLREAVSGPFKFYLEEEYPEGADSYGFPDMSKEIKFYKKAPDNPRGYFGLRDMIKIYTFDESGKVEVDGVIVESLGRNRYRLERPGEPALECKFQPTREHKVEANKPVCEEHGFYQPPLFGVTIIGSGHGFDTESKTSGFIIWVDGKGILVDPPVNSTHWMQQNRVNTRLIEDLILTHCHADHDSGTLQKILEEGRIRVHSTKTVMHSFVAKYSAITKLRSEEFRTLFEFEPITIGTPTTVAGAKFRFKYNLHPIPTLGFQVEFQEESFYYSCDTLYCPETIRSLHQQGILSESRRDDLLDVPWDSSLVLHEAGIPPIHTPMAVLSALPDEVKQRMYLVHVSESAIPEGSGLRIATPGTEGTLAIPVEPPQKSLAVKILDVVSHIDLFSEMKFVKALECLAITQYQVVEPGEVFIKRDSYGDKFFMILSGQVEVIHESLPGRVLFGRYDYIGETALILNKPRNADIVARTRTELLYIERQDFLRFIRNTDLPEIFTRLDANRTEGARWVFEKHRILAGLSPLQKNQLMCFMLTTTMEKGTALFQEGEEVRWYYVVAQGEVRIEREGREAVLGSGAFVGELGRSYEASIHAWRARAETDLKLFKIAADDMHTFFSSYPGTFVRLAKYLNDTIRRGGRL